MNDGGAIQEYDKYSGLFLRITRAAGLLIPFVAVSYGTAAYYGFVSRSPAFSSFGFIAIAFLFITLGVVQLIVKPHTPVKLGVFIGFYHLLGSLYLFVGPGFISPIAFCWIVLAFITEIFYGRVGAIISVAVITLTSLVIIGAERDMIAHAFNYAVYLMIIVVSTILVIWLRRVQLVEHEDLKRTQIREQYQREQLKTLINSVGIAIASATSAGTIQTYNAALLDLLDTHDSLTNKPLDDAFHLIDKNGQPVSLQSVFASSDRVIERDDLRHQFANGETMNVSISCAPIASAGPVANQVSEGYIFIVRDITKAKSLEEERDEFISVVSHELRTPVAIVEATISLMLYEIEHKKDPSHLTTAFQNAHKQVLYLASMLKDLTTLSRAERGLADAVEVVNINDLLMELHRNYVEKATSKGLALTLELPPTVTQISTSKLYLEEILQNFLTNSIKYTEKGQVTLGAAIYGSEIHFTVKDTGIGISKTDQKRIFEKFYRSEDYMTRKHSGTGLGLYVVQKLAQKVKGRIVVDSTLNVGSTFTLILQKTTQAAATSSVPPATEPVAVPDTVPAPMK